MVEFTTEEIIKIGKANPHALALLGILRASFGGQESAFKLRPYKNLDVLGWREARYSKALDTLVQLHFIRKTHPKRHIYKWKLRHLND